MDHERYPRRLRPRLGLRGAAVALVLVAVGLAFLRPAVQEPLRRFERYARVKLNEADLYRHIEGAPRVAERFVRALLSGRPGEAGGLTTAGYLRRMGARPFATFAGRDPQNFRSWELVEAVLGFSDRRGQYVSTVTFRCRDIGGRPTWIKAILVTESGAPKVDGVAQSSGPLAP